MKWETFKYASLSAAERDKADAYAGPDKSFPLYKNGEHLRAAWDLAGHSANPEATRAKILAFAREHGLHDYLPADAQKHGTSDMAKKAVLRELVFKAKSADIKDLLSLAWEHEASEGDKSQQMRLAHWAKRHGVSHFLPSDAHTAMHEHGIVHEHEGMQNDEYGQHEHPVKPEFVKKAFLPDEPELLVKAWGDAGTLYVEGWISTPDRDLQKDIVVPEAFTDSLDEFAGLGMPCSSEHDTEKYPKGHGQHIALVRDGVVFKSAKHPTDSAEFQHFPGVGTGVYGRVAITESDAAAPIRKGNVRGFSWIGLPVETEHLPSGGKLIKKVNPWKEITVAAYPVNGRARMLATE